ncbi:hypothetical protein EJ110_NYTH31531 [Nymphaea thermarum]|nr:hypothetical protein EJ110_NYTH31531 [Nymphaea thermarum]
MSDAQQDHALAIERLAPRLAALSIELCPKGCFWKWKIYFVLLQSRLSKPDAGLLSTSQGVSPQESYASCQPLKIIQARSMLQELQKQARAVAVGSDNSYGQGAKLPSQEAHTPKSELGSCSSEIQPQSDQKV